jgi:hypothetical protein
LQNEKSKSTAAADFSRRDFARSAAAAVATARFAPAQLLAAGTTRDLSFPEQEQQQGELPPKIKAQVEDKLARIFAQWGDRLNDSQRARLRTVVTRHVQMLEAVRAISVTNADPPASVLKLVTASRATSANTKP